MESQLKCGQPPCSLYESDLALRTDLLLRAKARRSEAALYKNLTRAQIRDSVAYRVCQDLDSRFAVSQGLARRLDYRDELASHLSS